MLKKYGTERYFLSCMHNEKQKVAMTLTGKINNCSKLCTYNSITNSKSRVD